MTKKQAIKIVDVLWERAVLRYLDKTDWDICEWLDEYDKKLYIEANKLLNVQ